MEKKHEGVKNPYSYECRIEDGFLCDSSMSRKRQSYDFQDDSIWISYDGEGNVLEYFVPKNTITPLTGEYRRYLPSGDITKYAIYDSGVIHGDAIQFYSPEESMQFVSSTADALMKYFYIYNSGKRICEGLYGLNQKITRFNGPIASKIIRPNSGKYTLGQDSINFAVDFIPLPDVAYSLSLSINDGEYATQTLYSHEPTGFHVVKLNEAIVERGKYTLTLRMTASSLEGEKVKTQKQSFEIEVL